MAQPALIFIPDISGFTRFVTQTEIQHANHIISELVGVILESNRLDLALSEIEGDAVLFYRLGKAPSPQELLDQAQTMFVEFHRYLKIIHRDNVCQCGACTTASGLSLKFVAHYGALDEVRIQQFLKLMGQDVILAHRLLKNEVPGDEYLLITNGLIADGAISSPHHANIQLTPHQEHVPEFGDVLCAYLELTPLLASVPEPPERKPLVMKGGFSASIDILAPIDRVHDYVTDMDKRETWAEGLRDIVGGEPINRIGDSHTCVFDRLEVDVETLDHRASEDGFTYTEQGKGLGVVLVTQHRLSDRNGTTGVNVTMTASPPDPSLSTLRSWVERIRARVVLYVASRGLKKGLRALKAVCEQEVSEPAIEAPRHQPAAR